DPLLVRVALDVAQQHALDLAVDLEVEDRRVEPLVLAGEPGLLVLELDAHRRGLAAVDDGRHETGMTKAAARTLPLVLAARGLDGVLVGHVSVAHFACVDAASRRRWRLPRDQGSR